MKEVVSYVAGWALVLALAASSVTPAGAQGERRSVLDGVYTAEQALRGARFTDRACGHCHNDTYYVGTLLESWKGATVQSLYNVIRRTMPEDRPGSLKAQEYADLMAYILELNGLPKGPDELLADDLDILIEIDHR